MHSRDPRPAPPPSTPRSALRGFSLVEVVIVIAIIAIVTAYAVPALSTSSDAKAARGAANVLESMLSTARAAAITRGRCATMHLNANAVWITTETCGGTPIDTVTMQDLARAFGVTVQACSGSYCSPGDALDYVLDPRGIPYWGTAATWVAFRNDATDTVQVGQFGLVQ
ncbi:MAG TPA: prepilin-type N-terminal cleavage/methylation domain-containing protein [Gemmatimonadales bacterium]|nr:prepilin-type N-terminal cleavage/methylation domain-containing protein [Gemmatimonadales bacterium]